MAIAKWTRPTAVLAMTVAMVMLPLASVLAQEIYKTVDENGNVVYTDQKPSEDAVPVTLKELTVVDPVELGEAGVIESGVNNGSSGEQPDFGLEIVSPAAGETISNTAYVLSVQVRMARQLPAGAQLAYLVDGEVLSTTRSMSVELEEVYRGEHQLSVELRRSDGSPLATAGPITFYMRQHSRLHPNPG